jgi:hypothetical protein
MMHRAMNDANETIVNARDVRFVKRKAAASTQTINIFPSVEE